MMMRQVIAIIILWLTVTDPAIAQVWFTRKSYELQGPVKSVRTETIKSLVSEDQAKTGNAVLDDETCFDEKGRAISQTSYYYNATTKMKGSAFFNTFDTQGKLRLSKLAEPGGTPYADVIASYSENNRKVVLDYTLPNGVVYFRYTHLLNEHGKTTEKSSGQPSNSPHSYESYVYDDKGRLIEWVRLNGEKQLLGRSTTSFDDKTRTNTLCHYNEKGKITLKIVMRLDEHGRVSQSASFDENDRLTRNVHLTYKLDHFGNWIELAARPDPSDAMTSPRYQRRVITYYK